MGSRVELVNWRVDESGGLSGVGYGMNSIVKRGAYKELYGLVDRMSVYRASRAAPEYTGCLSSNEDDSPCIWVEETFSIYSSFRLHLEIHYASL